MLKSRREHVRLSAAVGVHYDRCVGVLLTTETKAMRLPSGDQAGSPHDLFESVRFRNPVPSALATNMLKQPFRCSNMVNSSCLPSGDHCGSRWRAAFVQEKPRVFSIWIGDLDFPLRRRTDDIGDFRTIGTPRRLGGVVGFIGELDGIGTIDADSSSTAPRRSAWWRRSRVARLRRAPATR